MAEYNRLTIICYGNYYCQRKIQIVEYFAPVAYNTYMSDKIDDIVIPVLREIQSDLSVVKTDVSILKETTGKIDARLKIVESHMSGFMSSARFLEAEIDELRGRIEALEERDQTPSPAE